MHRRHRIFRFLGPVLLVILSIQPQPAQAHAEYKRSEPAAGAVIAKPPGDVHVWFTHELFRREDANTLEVYGPGGARVDNGDARIDDDDRTRLFVSLQTGLPAGTYTVRWRTLSAEDFETDSGEFSFALDPSVAETTSQPSPTTTPVPTRTPAPRPTAAPSPQATGGLTCLGSGVFGVVVLGVLVLGMWRRQRNTR